MAEGEEDGRVADAAPTKGEDGDAEGWFDTGPFDKLRAGF